MINPKKSIIIRVFILSVIFPGLMVINGCGGSSAGNTAEETTEITDSESITTTEEEKVIEPDITAPEGVNFKLEYLQDFDPTDWSDGDWITSPDGLWTVSNWGPATGNNYMWRSNFDIFETYPNDGGSGYISLKTTGSKNSPSQKLNGGEIFSPNFSERETQWGYGYYECRMKAADVGSADNNTGVCSSFFIQGNDGFEVDFEFLTNGLIGSDLPKNNWVNTENEGYVSTALHPGNEVKYINLGFNPSKDFHVYGILWLKDKIEWYVDGQCVRTETGNFSYDGLHIAMNNWTGDTNWGGLPPQDDAVSYYDFVKYYSVSVSETEATEKIETEKGFIKTNGTKFIDGRGNEFLIRGMGFWSGNPSEPPETFNENDYKNLASIGFNAVRFYMGAKFIENDIEKTFSWIDKHIAWAKQYNIKLILNLHYSPSDDPNVSISDNALFTNTDYQDRLVNLWRNLAEHYAGEPVILGYDIINEPNCRVLDGDSKANLFENTFKLYEDLMNRVIKAVREVDSNHIVIVERLWLSGVKESAVGTFNSSPNDQRDTWQNVNKKYNFPDIDDNNYAYTYHVYEPGRYAHQSAGGIDDDGSGGANRVYPSDTIAKWNEKDPNTGKPWTMNKDFLEYAYTIPLDYIRNVKGVPCYIGELGIHEDNFELNAFGVNKGGRQWVLDTVDIMNKYGLSFSWHSYFVSEIHPVFNAKLESALRAAFGTE